MKHFCKDEVEKKNQGKHYNQKINSFRAAEKQYEEETKVQNKFQKVT